MRSFNGGLHGLAGWCFRRLPETSAGLWTDDGADPVSVAGSSLAASDLRLAELRSVSEISGAEGLSRVLAGKAGRAVVLGDRGAFQADQAGRIARGGRRVQVALALQLKGFGSGWGGQSEACPPTNAMPGLVGTAQAPLPTLRI